MAPRRACVLSATRSPTCRPPKTAVQVLTLDVAASSVTEKPAFTSACAFWWRGMTL